jgi:L-fucose mutarotase
MLKGLDPVLTGELLKILAEMGHGNEVCLADANFPAKEVAGTRPLVWARGVSGPRMLKAVLSVLPLDGFTDAPATVMAVVGDATRVGPVVAEYQDLIDETEGRRMKLEMLERFAFYERARKCVAIVATGEGRPYGNIILTKGVIATT